MPCYTPYRDDAAQLLLFKIASCLADGGGGGGGVAGVASFNGRTGVVTLTSGDVTSALGFTPISQADGDARYVLKAGDTMTGSLNIANSAILVASDPALDITQTWNNAAVTFTGLQSNITNTASASDSNLFNFQTDGLDRFRYATIGQLFATRQDATNSGVTFFQRKRGSAAGATAAIAADATIGTLTHSGWDGAAYANGSRISGLANTLWTGANHGSRIDLYTTPDGSTSEQITLRLAATGQSLFTDGTAALPAQAYQSDLDTGLYRIGANSFGSSAGGSLILATSTTGINLTTALAYQYNAVNVIRAQTALNNYFFGPSGNLTMTGLRNTSVGSLAFASNTTGSDNTAVGYAALNVNTDGIRNSAFGAEALSNNTTGSANSATGYWALLSNTTGDSNVANGYQTLQNNTTGGNNVAIGRGALLANTTGGNNVGCGHLSLSTNTTGSDNVSFGYQSMLSNTTASRSVAIGSQALQLNTTGANNVAMGYLALFTNTTGANNVAIGYQALLDQTTPATGQNTAIGYNTGRGITTGNNNTILGANITGLAAGLSNNILISDGAGNLRITVDSTGVVSIPIGLTLATAAPLSMTSGANQRAGDAVLVAGTVTVANTTVTANTRVFVSRKTIGGTPGTEYDYTVIAATSFTINSNLGTDTSTISYMLLEVP